MNNSGKTRGEDHSRGRMISRRQENMGMETVRQFLNAEKIDDQTKAEFVRDILKMEYDARDKNRDRNFNAREREKDRAHEARERALDRQEREKDRRLKERLHEKRNKNNRRIALWQTMPKLLPAVAAIVILGILLGGWGLFDSLTKVRVPDSARHYHGERWESVELQLRDAGFENIEVKPIKDLSALTGLLNMENTVAEVSIDGITGFKADDYFSRRAKVRIVYHAYPDGEKLN